MKMISEYVPTPGLYLFHSFGAGPTLVLEFMFDGRLKVTGPTPDEGNGELYMTYEASKHFFTELLEVPFETFLPDDERYEDCLVV